MSLDAGSVWTLLGGRFNPAGFKEFDAANKNSARVAAESEAQISAAQARTAAATDKAAAATGRAAAASDAAAVSGRRLRESVPLAAMDQWGKNSEKAGQNLSKLGNVAAKGAAVGILALGAATIYAATKATTFNREMLKISTQAGGTTAEVKGLSSEVLKLAGTVPQGPQKLAEGLYHIESAGFRGAQAMSMLKASAMGAALGNADLQNTTQAMIAATASQIKGVHGAADAMGQLNAIVGVGDMRMEGLAQAMATGILPSAANAGLSLRDVGAALATVTDNATPANVTATRLRMTIALMASPSKAAAKELETIGMSSTQMAHDLRQPNGLLKAVEDLKTHLKDSGLTAEQQFGVLSKVFGGGRSSAVIQTLIAETDRLKTKYKELAAINGPTRLAKSWGEFQASNAATFSELKSGAEAFAITVGDVVLPSLAKLAHEGAHAMSGFISSGGAAQAGADITHVFETLGQVVGNIAPVIAGVARALVEVGSAAGLGNAGELTGLVAAFVAFRTVTFVAPILLAIAAGISEIGVAAATAGSLSAFGGDMVALAGGPVGALAIALSLAAGAFVALQSGMFASSSAADQNAAALRADKQAIEGLNHATTDAARSELEAKQATLDNRAAKDQLAKDEKLHREGKASDLQIEQDRLQVLRTGLHVQESQADAIKKVNAERAKAESAANQIGQKHGEKGREVEESREQLKLMEKGGAIRGVLADKTKQLVDREREYNAEVKQQAQLMAQVSVAEVSRNRLQHGKEAITPQNAPGVNQLQIALSGAPQKIIQRYELDDQGAQAKLGALASKMEQLGHGDVMVKILTTAPSAGVALEAFRAILHGVPSSKVVSILHNAPSARAAMGALTSAVHAVPTSKAVTIATNAAAARGEIQSVQAAIDGLSGKSIAVAITKTFTTVESIVKKATGHASGRGSGQSEASLVGEGAGPEYIINRTSGQGVMVNQPTVMGLSPDDYVIPLEDRYRGRALGLFAMLARDLEVPGYKAGKAAKPKGKAKHPMPVPNAIPPLSLPLGDIEQKESTAKSKYEHAASKVTSLEGKVQAAERTLHWASSKGTAKAKDAARVKELKGELAKAKQAHDYTVEHKKMQEWERTLREAKAFQAQINERTQEANNAGNAMKLAAEHDNFGAYTAAKGKRLGALGQLQALIKKAQAQVKTGSEYALQLEGQLQSAQLEAGATGNEELEPAKSKAAAAEEQTGMTEAERAQLKHIEASVALAALTPDLGDDKTAAGQLVGFLQGILGEVQAEPGPRGGDESIKSIADSLKTARGNLESLSGTGTNENADLQAQITQANERTAQATRSAQIAEQALQVFSGSGDIGAGGQNATAAVVQNIYTLHPGDPATQLAVGNAAVAGIGLQGSRRAVRQQVGP